MTGPDEYPAPGAPGSASDPQSLPPTHQSPSTWGWGQPPGPGLPPWAHQPGMFAGAAHKPCAIPLRPLTLGDIYDAAFKIIRFNPKATVGAAVLVAGVAMAIPVVLTAILTFALDMSIDPEATDFSQRDAIGMASSLGSFGLGAVLQSLGLILVTGMIARVVAGAAVGRRMTLGEAWAATAGKRWRLIGLALLLGFVTTLILAVYIGAWALVILASPSGWVIAGWAAVSVPAFLIFMPWFWIRFYYLPVPALMLEPIGVIEAIRRGYSLSSRAFWRTFGIAVLTLIVAQIASSMLAMPFSFLGQVGMMAGATTQYFLLIFMLTQAVSTVITTAFVAPFTGSVTALQYLDLRIRKEAFDVELMNRAGITRA